MLWNEVNHTIIYTSFIIIFSQTYKNESSLHGKRNWSESDKNIESEIVYLYVYIAIYVYFHALEDRTFPIATEILWSDDDTVFKCIHKCWI